MARSASMMVPSFTSLPMMVYPLDARICTSGNIPLPPMPMKCRRETPASRFLLNPLVIAIPTNHLWPCIGRPGPLPGVRLSCFSLYNYFAQK